MRHLHSRNNHETKPNGIPPDSRFVTDAVAIETTLMLGMVFGLRLRQSEGLLSSLLALMGLDLPVPDHTILSRRERTWMPTVERRAVPDAPLHVLVDSTGLKVYDAGQWLEEKH